MPLVRGPAHFGEQRNNITLSKFAGWRTGDLRRIVLLKEGILPVALTELSATELGA